MIAKSLKIGIVLAVMFSFFGGTAMADGRRGDRQHRSNDRGYHQSNEHQGAPQYRHHNHRQYHKGDRRYYAHRGNVHRKHWARHNHYKHPVSRHDHRRVDKRHRLAPDFVFLGPIPVPVPPPPHVVLGLGR